MNPFALGSGPTAYVLLYVSASLAFLAAAERLLPESVKVSLRDRLVSLWMLTQQPMSPDALRQALLKAQRLPFQYIPAFARMFKIAVVLMACVLIFEEISMKEDVIRAQVDGIVRVESGFITARFNMNSQCYENFMESVYYRDLELSQRYARYLSMSKMFSSLDFNELRMANIIASIAVISFFGPIAYFGFILSLRVSRAIMNFSRVFIFGPLIYVIIQVVVSMTIPLISFYTVIFTIGIITTSHLFFKIFDLNGQIAPILTAAALMIHNYLTIFSLEKLLSGSSAGLAIAMYLNDIHGINYIIASGLVIVFNYTKYIERFVIDELFGFWEAMIKTMSGNFNTDFVVSIFYWSLAINLLIDVLYVLSVGFLFACAKSPFARGVLGKLIEKVDAYPGGIVSALEFVLRSVRKSLLGGKGGE
jgi:hypothetical protein